MTVSVREVILAMQSGRAALVGEIAGYLVLLAADCALKQPSWIDADSVLLEAEGTVRVQGRAVSEEEAEFCSRRLLAGLLLELRSPAPNLSRVASRSERRGLESLVIELEAALVPVNRRAAKRSLARLYRETERARATFAAGLQVEAAEEKRAPVAEVQPAPPVERERDISVAVQLAPAVVEERRVPVAEVQPVPVVVEPEPVSAPRFDEPDSIEVRQEVAPQLEEELGELSADEGVISIELGALTVPWRPHAGEESGGAWGDAFRVEPITVEPITVEPISVVPVSVESVVPASVEPVSIAVESLDSVSSAAESVSSPDEVGFAHPASLEAKSPVSEASLEFVVPDLEVSGVGLRARSQPSEPVSEASLQISESVVETSSKELVSAAVSQVSEPEPEAELSEELTPILPEPAVSRRVAAAMLSLIEADRAGENTGDSSETSAVQVAPIEVTSAAVAPTPWVSPAFASTEVSVKGVDSPRPSSPQKTEEAVWIEEEDVLTEFWVSTRVEEPREAQAAVPAFPVTWMEEPSGWDPEAPLIETPKLEARRPSDVSELLSKRSLETTPSTELQRDLKSLSRVELVASPPEVRRA